MSAQQTTYNLEQSAPSQPGAISDSGTANRLRPFRNDSGGAFAFGLGVCRSTDTDDRGFNVATASRQFLGVLTFGQIKQNGTDGLPSLEMGSILEEGEVYVKVVEDVTPDSVVRIFIVDHTGTLSNAVVGSFGDSAVSTKTAVLLNAKYVSRATTGNVAKLRLNAPGPVLLVAE